MLTALKTARNELSSFIPGARQSFAQALAALLGVDPALPVALEASRDGDASAGWSACLRVDGLGPALPPLHIELRDARPGAQGWFRGQHLVLGYWTRRDGVDPLNVPESKTILDRARARLEQVDKAGETDPALLAWREALARWRGFSQLNDRIFRYAEGDDALIRLGFRCNQKCDFCWQERDWPEPPAEHYHRWVDEIADLGVRSVQFSGGEPTIHPELPALVEHATRRGLHVSLQTNAVRLAKPGFVDKLVAAGLQGLFVSYHSHLPAISDAMTSAPGTHVFTERGILAALGAGLAVTLNTVVERRNFERLADHARHIVQTFGSGATRPVLVTYSHPGRYLHDEIFAAAAVPLDEVRAHLVEAIGILDAAGIDSETGGSCGFPACVFIERPELAQFTRPEQDTPENPLDRSHPRACEQCAAKHGCIGPRAPYLRHLGERGLVPFKTVPTWRPRRWETGRAPGPRS